MTESRSAQRTTRSGTARSRRRAFGRPATSIALWVLAGSLGAGCGNTYRLDAMRTDAGLMGDGGRGGDAGPGDGGKQETCRRSAFSTAPLVCSPTWTRATSDYPGTCRVNLGAYQASCDDFDAIIVEGPRSTTWCFYDRGTSNLIGSTEQTTAESTCLTFDPEFVRPALTACEPRSPGACTDAGP